MKAPSTAKAKLEALKQHLQLASELEQQLMCAYLFTAFTVRQSSSAADSTTRQQQNQTQKGWRGAITGVAVQEMLHLALVSNMLTAIGGTPYFQRQNFPLDAEDMERFGYQHKAKLGLWKFGQCSIERFAWFESYDGGKFPECPGEVEEPAARGIRPTHFISLRKLGLSSLVQLYKNIARLFKELAESDEPGFVLFQPPGALTSSQITDDQVTALFNYPPALRKAPDGDYALPLLNAVTDLKSAFSAIDTIIVQGEGDFNEWRNFLKSLIPQSEYPDMWPFPEIQSPSHEETFENVLNGIKAADWDIARKVVNNPLPDRISNHFTHKVSSLFNEVYGVMLDILGASFAHQGSPYAVASLTQGALRMMVYIMSPLGNLLTQLPLTPKGDEMAGPSFIYSPQKDHSWEYLERRLRKVADLARALAQAAPDQQVWLTPGYLGIPEGGNAYPQETISHLLGNMVGQNLEFMADRIADLQGYAVPELHVCMGLNACKGQDITGTATMAGVGNCATADPHICSGQNSCRNQGGCGFTPAPPGAMPDLQNHPGENDCRSLGACGSPILPSIINTRGNNTVNGDPEIYKVGQGSVWRYARLLFEKKMQARGQAYGPSEGPGGIGKGDFPGWKPSKTVPVKKKKR